MSLEDPDLSRRLQALDDPPLSLDAPAVRARLGRRRPLWRPLLAAAAVLLAVGVGVGLGDEAGLRARGLGAEGRPAVRLLAIAERDGTRRPLADGDRVPPEAPVVFGLVTDRPVRWTLDEEGPGGAVRVWPVEGEARADAGEHWVGGDRPLAWRPEDPSAGTRRYVIRACGPGADDPCASTALHLQWPDPDAP